MARARNIKPGFFKNELIAELPFEARLLFIGLWTLADRDGRLEDRAKRIKMELFPADSVEVEPLLVMLVKNGFIVRYEVDGQRYLAIENFAKHQSPHVKEQASTIPAPDKHGASTVLAPEIPAVAPPDSLIADSLNPVIKTLSGKPDANPLREKTQEARESAKRVLNFLNEKTGRAYRPTPAIVDMIAARIRDGATETECRQIIVRKGRDWSADEKMAQYLRPKTLFSRTNFENYLGELVA